MFRFWSTDFRSSEQTAETQPDQSQQFPYQSESGGASSQAGPCRSPAKRKWDSASRDQDDLAIAVDDTKAIKRTKRIVVRPDTARSCDDAEAVSFSDHHMDRTRDVIRHHVGLEVLLKHDELRLINQELAKCQIALEQLRRCHLIPYPQYCPTPDQMLDISSGKGPAAIKRFGEPVPRWAPPFGVTDGPYARHYAKWLIPDPSFDGDHPKWQFTPELSRSRIPVVEGRTTRNGFTETGPVVSRGRPVRGNAGQKLQALSSGYPPPKDKAGPCILKRSDGQTVKLVCLDCSRENFSSTQGFINHCRIAHKRDFKSHEEAAVHSGQPIDGSGEAGEASPVAAVAASASARDDKAHAQSRCSTSTNTNTNTSTSLPQPTSVHPFARPAMTDEEAYTALRSRIADSLALYRQGKLPGVAAAAAAAAATTDTAADVASTFDPAADAPHLSRLMQSRAFNGSLRDVVADAKTKTLFDDMTPPEESDDANTSTNVFDERNDAAPTRHPVVKRVPAPSGNAPGASKESVACQTRGSASSKSRPRPVSLMSPPDSTLDAMSKPGFDGVSSDVDEDMEAANLSPNTLVSNNAPSLVSDDGEYDDSDDASSMSDGSEERDSGSVSDVAEITLDDDHDTRPLRREANGVPGTVRLLKDNVKAEITLDDGHDTRPLRREAKGVPGTVRLRKDNAKKQHVTFLGPVKNQSKQRRLRRT